MPERFKHYRDKDLARRTRNRQRRNNYSKSRREDYKRRWTDEEMGLVLDSGLGDRELGEIISRSVQAIQMRRWKLKNGMVTINAGGG